MDASVRFTPPQGLRVTDSQLEALLPSGVCPDSGAPTLEPVNPVEVQGTDNLDSNAVLSSDNARIILNGIFNEREGSHREVTEAQIGPLVRIINHIVNGNSESTELSCLTVAELSQNDSLRELVRFAFENAISGRPFDPQAVARAEDGPDHRQDLAALAVSRNELDSPVVRRIRNGALQLRVDMLYDEHGVLDGYRLFLRYFDHEEAVATFHRGQGSDNQTPNSPLAREVIAYWQRVLRGNRYLDANAFTEGTIDEDTLNAYRTYSQENNLMANFYDPEDILHLIGEKQRELNVLYSRICTLYDQHRNGQLNTSSTQDLSQRCTYVRMVESALNQLNALIGLARQYESLASQRPGQEGLSAADRRLGAACQTIIREYSEIAENLLREMFLGLDPLIALDRLSLQETREASLHGNVRHKADKRGQYLSQLVRMIDNLTRWRAMAQAQPEVFAVVREEIAARLAELRLTVSHLPEREGRWVNQELSYLDPEVMRSIEAQRSNEAPNNQVLYQRYRRTRNISEHLGNDEARQTIVGIVSGFIREADFDRPNRNSDSPTDSLGLLLHAATLFVGNIDPQTGHTQGGLIAQDGDDMLAACQLNYENGNRQSVGLARNRGGDSVADFNTDSLGPLNDTDKGRVQRMMGQLYGYITQNEPELLNNQAAMLARFREILENIIFVIGALQEIPYSADGRLNTREMRFTLSPLNGTCHNGEQANKELGKQLDQSSHGLLQRDFAGLSGGSSMIFTPRALRQLEVRMVDNFSTGGTVPYSDIEGMRAARPALRPLLASFPTGSRAFISDLGVVAVPETVTDVPDATADRGPQFGVIETRDPVSFARELPVAFLNLIVAVQSMRNRSGRITDEDQLREFGRTPGQLTANNLRLYLEIFGTENLWVVNPNALSLNRPEIDVLTAVSRILQANRASFGNISDETIALLDRMRSSDSEITFTPEEKEQLWALIADLRIWNGTVGRSNFRRLARETISEAHQQDLLTFLREHRYLDDFNGVTIEANPENPEAAEAAFVADLESLDWHWLSDDQIREVYQLLLRAAGERANGTLFTSLEQEAGRADQGQRTDLTTALDRLERATSRMTVKLGLEESDSGQLDQLAHYLSWGDNLAPNDPLRLALTIWDTRLARETPTSAMLDALHTLADRDENDDRTFTEQDEANFLALYSNCIGILRRMGNQAFAMSFRTPEDESRWEGWLEAGMGIYRNMAMAATETIAVQRRTDFRASGLPSDQIFYINMITHPELAQELDFVNQQVDRLDALITDEVVDGNSPLAQQVDVCQRLVDNGDTTTHRPPGQIIQILREIEARHHATPLRDDSRLRGPLSSFQGLVQDSLVRMRENPTQFITQAHSSLYQIRMQRDAVNRELAVLSEREASLRRNPAAANVQRDLSGPELSERQSLIQMGQALDLLTQELTTLIQVTEEVIPDYRQKSSLVRRRSDLVGDLQDGTFDAEDFDLLLAALPDLADTSFTGARLPAALSSVVTSDFGRFDDVNRRYTGRFPIEVLQEYFRNHPDAVLSYESLNVVIGPSEDHSNAVLALQQICQLLPTQRQYVDITRVAPTLLPMRWQAMFPGGSHGMLAPVRDFTAMFGTLVLGERAERSFGPRTLDDLRNYSSNWYRVWFNFLSFLSMSSAERGRMELTSQVYMAMYADPRGQEMLAHVLGDTNTSSNLPLNQVSRPVMERFFNYYQERFSTDLANPSSDLSQLVTELYDHNEIALSRQELLEMMTPEGIQDLMGRLPNTDTFQIFDSRHETDDRAQMRRVSRFIEAVLMIQGRMNEVSPGRNPRLYAVSQADPQTDARRSDVHSVLDPLAHRFHEVTAIVHNPSLTAETARNALGESAGQVVEDGLTWVLGAHEAQRYSHEIELPGGDLRDDGITADFSPNIENWIDDAIFSIYRLAQNIGRDSGQVTLEQQQNGIGHTAYRTTRGVEDGTAQGLALKANLNYVMGRSIGMSFADFWAGGVAEGGQALIEGDSPNIHHSAQFIAKRGGHTGGSFSFFNLLKQSFFTDPISDLFSGNYFGFAGKSVVIRHLVRAQGSNAYLSDMFQYVSLQAERGWTSMRAILEPALRSRSRNLANEARIVADRLRLRDTVRLIDPQTGRALPGIHHTHERFAADTGVKIVKNVVIRPVKSFINLAGSGLNAVGDAVETVFTNPTQAAQSIRNAASRVKQAVRNPGVTTRAAGRGIADRASAAETRVVDWVTGTARNNWWRLTGDARRPGRVVPFGQGQAGWFGRTVDWLGARVPGLGWMQDSNPTRYFQTGPNGNSVRRSMPRSIYQRASSYVTDAVADSRGGAWVARRFGAQNLRELSSVVAEEGQAVGRPGINWVKGIGDIFIGIGGAEIGEDVGEGVGWMFDMSQHSAAYQWMQTGFGLAGGIFAVASQSYLWPVYAARAADQLVCSTFIDGYELDLRSRAGGISIDEAATSDNTSEHVAGSLLILTDFVAPNLSRVFLVDGDTGGDGEANTVAREDATIAIPYMQRTSSDYLRDNWLEHGLFDYDGSTSGDINFFRGLDLDQNLRENVLPLLTFENQTDATGQEVLEADAYDYAKQIFLDMVDASAGNIGENTLRIYQQPFTVTTEQRRTLETEYHITDVDGFLQRVQMRHLMSRLALLDPTAHLGGEHDNNRSFRTNFDELRQRTPWEGFLEFSTGRRGFWSALTGEANMDEIGANAQFIIHDLTGNDHRTETLFESCVSNYRLLRRMDALRSGSGGAPTEGDRHALLVNRDGTVSQDAYTSYATSFIRNVRYLQEHQSNLIPQNVADYADELERIVGTPAQLREIPDFDPNSLDVPVSSLGTIIL